MFRFKYLLFLCFLSSCSTQTEAEQVSNHVQRYHKKDVGFCEISENRKEIVIEHAKRIFERRVDSSVHPTNLKSIVHGSYDAAVVFECETDKIRKAK